MNDFFLKCQNEVELPFVNGIHNCNAENETVLLLQKHFGHFYLGFAFGLVRICEMSDSYTTSRDNPIWHRALRRPVLRNNIAGSRRTPVTPLGLSDVFFLWSALLRAVGCHSAG